MASLLHTGVWFIQSFILSTQHCLGGQTLAKIPATASPTIAPLGPQVIWLHACFPFSLGTGRHLIAFSLDAHLHLSPSSSHPTSSSLGNTANPTDPVSNQRATPERWHCLGLRWLFEELTFDQSTEQCPKLSIHLKAP